MQRWFLAGCAAFLFTVVVSTARGDDTGPINLLSPVPKLISQLSDPDPAIRLDSVQRLINQGEAARPLLRRAMATADPQARCEIDRILLHIRWVGFGDSDPIEHAFANYAEEDPETRCVQIDSWLSSAQSSPGSALLRIITADPSPAVRWEAASVLVLVMTQQADPVISRQLVDLAAGIGVPREAYLPPDQNAPLLAAAGWALEESKPAQAAELMSKAVAIESDHPSAFRGQMDFVFGWLSARAAEQKNYQQMVQLLRQQADRSPWNPAAIPDSVARLFAAHADFGPLPGLADDLRCYQEYLGHPEMIYAMARLLDRRDHHLAANAVKSIALLLGGTSVDSHFQTGAFLARLGWNAAAERELLYCLTLSDGKAYYAYFQLSELASLRDDDLAAARYLERGVKEMHAAGQMQQINLAGQLESQIQWHYIRAYRQSHDRAALADHLDKFLQMEPNAQLLEKDPGMAADIVPAMQELGRTEQADQIFDTAYQALMTKIIGDPADPMAKNNLAWLCACSGKKLEEAVKFADQAVAMAPEDAACLDTQAETYLRTGQAKRAVEIETHALEIKPDDVYMKKQLDRFRAAAR